jgi:hypothetical protein
MKIYVPILIAVIGFVALIMSSVTTAQVTERAKPSQWSEIRLQPGQQIVVNASNNSIVEVTTDLTLTSPENLIYVDPQNGNIYSLPNGNNIVRMQGNVVISRDKDATSRTDPNVRWRYVETIWPAYGGSPR